MLANRIIRFLILGADHSTQERMRTILTGCANSDNIARALVNYIGDHPFASSSHTVTTADNCTQGRSLVMSALRAGIPFDVVLFDTHNLDRKADVAKITALQNDLESLWEADAGLPIILCTAHSQTDWGEFLQRFEGTQYLMVLIKPFEDIELSQLAVAMGHKRKLAHMAQSYSSVLEIERREKHCEIHAAHIMTIERLVTASMYRDKETGSHIRRVGMMSAALSRLADRAGLSSTDEESMRLAAPMHDIGKIGIPDSVLQKPGPLTEAEHAIMQRHTLLGAELLGGNDVPLLQLAAEIALSHHERWDGTGYPYRKSGNQIPISARIVSIVDVYDAIANDRVYRKAFAPDRVLRMLEEGSGNQFDPILTEIFIKEFDLFESIRLAFPDQANELQSNPLRLALAMPVPQASVSAGAMASTM